MADSNARAHSLMPGPYGFKWGPMSVVRVAEHRGYLALDISAGKQRITVYVSPTGRSVRVFGKGGEWKPADGDA